MRRLVEKGCHLLQIGIRSLSREEYDFLKSNPRVTTYFAHQLAEQWSRLIEQLGALAGDVHLTVDVDGLDPSVIPSTGTPQPNGLSWGQTMAIFRALAAAPRARWTGADVVEFVPSPHPPGCDLTAARLLHKMLAFRHQSQRSVPA